MPDAKSNSTLNKSECPVQSEVLTRVADSLERVSRALDKIAENTRPATEVGDETAAKKLVAYTSIAQMGGNVAKIARVSGLDRSTLYRDDQFMTLIKAFKGGGRRRVRRGTMDAKTGTVDAWD